jgi:hypothetical protein
MVPQMDRGGKNIAVIVVCVLADEVDSSRSGREDLRRSIKDLAEKCFLHWFLGKVAAF